METLTIPLFPLYSVLFPGGPLQLRVFEPRYLDMISQCLKNETGFGVCMIREGRETGLAAETYDVGTLGYISYWHKRSDGLLGVTVKGERRFRIHSRTVLPNQLIEAEVELLPEEPEMEVVEDDHFLVEMLQQMMEQLDHPYITLDKRYDDAAWVSGRLVELLPLELAQKQQLLQLDDPAERLAVIRAILDKQSL